MNTTCAYSPNSTADRFPDSRISKDSASRIEGTEDSPTKEHSSGMRSICEKVFARYLKPTRGREHCYFQDGQTQVMIESRQWKMAYSPLEKVTFDVSDEHALLLEVPGDNGVHLVPWHMVLRITVNQGGHL